MTLDWVKKYGRRTFMSGDFGLGVVAALGFGVASGLDATLRGRGNDLLIAELGLGIAVVAVVLAALAILVAMLDEMYLRILEYAGGVRAAVMPYRTVAVAAAWTSLVAAVGLFVFDVVPWWARSGLLALASGLAVWSLYGTVQLVGLTAKHGIWRGDLLGVIRDARRNIDDVKAKRPREEERASG